MARRDLVAPCEHHVGAVIIKNRVLGYIIL